MMNNWVKAYCVVGALLACWQFSEAAFGLELTADSRERIPDDVRRSAGGYRSFHFWHDGFHGGK